jgi:hypothetical protein
MKQEDLKKHYPGERVNICYRYSWRVHPQCTGLTTLISAKGYLSSITQDGIEGRFISDPASVKGIPAQYQPISDFEFVQPIPLEKLVYIEHVKLPPSH